MQGLFCETYNLKKMICRTGSFILATSPEGCHIQCQFSLRTNNTLSVLAHIQMLKCSNYFRFTDSQPILLYIIRKKRTMIIIVTVLCTMCCIHDRPHTHTETWVLWANLWKFMTSLLRPFRFQKHFVSGEFQEWDVGWLRRCSEACRKNKSKSSCWQKVCYFTVLKINKQNLKYTKM